MTATPPALPGSAPPATTRILVLPRKADAAALARAWFPEAAWVRETELPSRPAAVGARFRGMVPTQRTVPGELRLTWSAHLEGPLDAEDLAALGIASPVGADAVPLRLVTAPGAPHDPRLDAWLRAAARRAGGAVLHAPGDAAVLHAPGDAAARAVPGAPGAPSVPGLHAEPTTSGPVLERRDPESAVGLTVFSAVPVSPEVMLGLVRAVVPAARVTSAPEPDEGIAPYTLELPSQFDGAVAMRFSRAPELPVCLLQLDWRDYGPFAYQAAWTPPAELGAVPDEALLRVARGRVWPVIARLAFAIQRAAGGAVVEEDGFVVGHEELVARAVSM
ncbi:MAG: hypothetical protein GX593_13305 [Actinomycetales bacterium]|nr:hypothetical protein [Actinomycetales bacterium]